MLLLIILSYIAIGYLWLSIGGYWWLFNAKLP
jgi:hypothetical protein